MSPKKGIVQALPPFSLTNTSIPSPLRPRVSRRQPYILALPKADLSAKMNFLLAFSCWAMALCAMVVQVHGTTCKAWTFPSNAVDGNRGNYWSHKSQNMWAVVVNGACKYGVSRTQ